MKHQRKTYKYSYYQNYPVYENCREEYDITLLSPPGRMINHYRPPISLIYLGGYLTHKGLRVKIIDCPAEAVVRNKGFYQSKEKIIEGIKKNILKEVENIETNFVGISCYSSETKEVLWLIQEIRKRSKAKIIVGGAHCMLNPEFFKKVADYTVVGEGEVALFEIIKGREAGIIKAEIHDIDEISRPDYSLVDMKYYTRPNIYAIRGIFLRPAYISASRGCPAACKFCVAPKLRPYLGVGRFRHIEKIFAEILMLKFKYKIDGFYFVDDYFTFRKGKVIEFCNKFKALNTGLIWGCSSRVKIDEETIKAMSEAGCVQMDFGVERGSDEAMEALNKYQTVKQVKKTFALCKKYKIRTFANMLINVKGETEEDYKDIETLLEEIKPTVVSMNVYEKYLGDELEEAGGILREVKDFNSVWSNLKFHLTWQYLKIILKSKKKFSYLMQIGPLIKELINQRR